MQPLLELSGLIYFQITLVLFVDKRKTSFSPQNTTYIFNIQWCGFLVVFTNSNT